MRQYGEKAADGPDRVRRLHRRLAGQPRCRAAKGDRGGCGMDSDKNVPRPSGYHRAERGLSSPELPGSEACLEAIFVLSTEGEEVRAARVAEYLGVSAVTVSKGLRRLEEAGRVVARTPVIRLSPEGWRQAGLVVRRHRLLERWLADRLGLGLVEAHREAERLEHAMSPVVTEALWRDLGAPGTCPHGNPIPDEDGVIPHIVEAVPLVEALEGPARIDRIFEQLEGLEPLLHWVEEHELLPGRLITIMGRSPEGIALGAPGGALTTVPDVVARRLLVVPGATLPG